MQNFKLKLTIDGKKITLTGEQQREIINQLKIQKSKEVLENNNCINIEEIEDEDMINLYDWIIDELSNYTTWEEVPIQMIKEYNLVNGTTFVLEE